MYSEGILSMQGDGIARHANASGVSYLYFNALENVQVEYRVRIKKAANGVEKFCARSIIKPVDQARAYWSKRTNVKSPIIASVLEDFILNLKYTQYPNVIKMPEGVRKDVATVMMTVIDKVCGGYSVDSDSD